ncbi:DUF1194 domain-containing protein [Accumulibacter sp.]|jgi:hypothetical protein|uniref:DUF1194 domain-containing protein n=1 Tax=Accumulibacter sp. TaxID=2053492 RepID=UPI00258547A2|nr:DUF1194 domain-containing protein [Accumulibacter sp.]
MKPIKHAVKSILATAVLAFGVSSAQAAPTTALYLTMDGSGSISGADFTTQVNSYVNALNNIFAATPSLFGQVAIGGGIFGANFSQFFATQEITNAGVLANLTAAISGLNPGRGGINTGATAIGDAVTASANALVAYENSLQSDIKLLIDVTTDGFNNSGSDPNVAANAVTPSPVDSVNCLGIGAAASCAWVAGAGTDFGSALNFAEFQAALEGKIKQEFDVPEPGTLAILGLGLIGMVASRRKQ